MPQSRLCIPKIIPVISTLRLDIYNSEQRGTAQEPFSTDAQPSAADEPPQTTGDGELSPKMSHPNPRTPDPHWHLHTAHRFQEYTKIVNSTLKDCKRRRRKRYTDLDSHEE
ncbi:hypothetical protein C2S52_016217 [Perilla frutescens var. hirtella]|nr:hypothetical protein C2S52_016217 [Perilla frutescens var. hirtella]